MSETPKVPHFESAEKKFLIEPESGYFQAIHFAHDPVQHFINFRQYLFDESFEEADWGVQAMAELSELEEIINNENIPIMDDRVAALHNMDYLTEEWALNAFSILKEAGFTKKQLTVFFESLPDELTPEEKFRERTALFYLNKIFNT